MIYCFSYKGRLGQWPHYALILPQRNVGRGRREKFPNVQIYANICNMDKLAAKEGVRSLVSKFKAIQEEGGLKRYTEEETKKDFILPLFHALGWEVHDKREVSAEETISGKRVDYGFYIAGHAQFYVEAKNAKDETDNPKFANQATSYAWNKGVTWAILTNFKTLEIFNAQSADESIASRRFKSIAWDEYGERFDELWLLSREACETGELDKEAEKAGKKLKRVSVTSKLVEDLNEARATMSQALLTWNPTLAKDPHLLDEGVQRILDRIIFIRVLEDRGIEPPTLRPLVREWSANYHGRQIRDKLLYQAMEEKFRDLDDIYNSNLFASHASDTWEEQKNVIENIIEKFYGKENYYEYDFKAIPADILGTVYEQYLGHRLAKAAKGDLFGGSDLDVAKDARKRKEQGIYYTPRFIVDYIVENALGPVLAKCESITDLQKIKVLDPACGSGSFLIKALELIYKRYQEMGAEGEFVKFQILKNNLYGVDLDDQAVEIARLNLLIAALEKRMKMPGLDNIRNGNSLISGEDEELKRRFGKNWRDKKPFNWEKEFPEVFAQGGFDVIIGNPPYIKEYINKSAFDGLHESPYYQGKMDIWTMFASVATDLLKDGGVLSFIAPNNWVTNAGASKFRNKILSEGELKTFIDFGDYKVFDTAGIQTMIFAFEKGNPQSNYSAEYLRIDDKDIVEEKLVTVLHKEKRLIKIEPARLIDKNITFSGDGSSVILDKIEHKRNFVLTDKEVGQGIVSPQEFAIGQHAALIKEVQPGDGIFVLDEAELKKLRLTAKEKSIIRPFYKTEQISRYNADKHNLRWIIYSDKNVVRNIKQYPNIKQHLDRFTSVITSDFGPYGLHRARNEEFFKGPSIFSIRKTDRPQFSYVDFPCYVSQTFFIISTKRVDLKFLTGLLNSELVAFWLRHKGKLQGDQLQVDKGPLLDIPLCIGNKAQQKRVSTLVDKMINLNTLLHTETENSEKWSKLKIEIERTDKEIDGEVCKLYGLTDEEVQTVEQATT